MATESKDVGCCEQEDENISRRRGDSYLRTIEGRTFVPEDQSETSTKRGEEKVVVKR